MQFSDILRALINQAREEIEPNKMGKDYPCDLAIAFSSCDLPEGVLVRTHLTMNVVCEPFRMEMGNPHFYCSSLLSTVSPDSTVSTLYM
jgi:hypothetical protein